MAASPSKASTPSSQASTHHSTTGTVLLHAEGCSRNHHSHLVVVKTVDPVLQIHGSEHGGIYGLQ
jgi:hypothetical protein